MQARYTDKELLRNRVGVLEGEMHSLSDQLPVAQAKIKELTTRHVVTIDTLHANYKR